MVCADNFFTNANDNIEHLLPDRIGPAMLADIKRAVSRTLVRTTTASRAFAGADWSEVMPSESVEFADVAAPPFAPEAGHLDPKRFSTPLAVTAPVRGALYYSYLNVLLTPQRGIVLETDNTCLEWGDKSAADVFYWRNLYFKQIEDIPGVSFALRSAANNFYHTLVDNLPRLYALHDTRYRDTQIELLVPGSLRPYEQYFLNRMLPESVRIRKVECNRLYRPATIVFSSFLSRPLSGYLPRKYLEFFRERTLPSRPRQKRHRIYITRKDTAVGRRILNEGELIRVAEQFGFQSHTLEGMSLAAQIELFFDAEAVLAPHGAGLTNLLFSDHVGVVELHPTPTAFPHYYFLSQALGHRYRCVCSNAPIRHSDFTVDVKAVGACLADILGARTPVGVGGVSALKRN